MNNDEQNKRNDRQFLSGQPGMQTDRRLGIFIGCLMSAAFTVYLFITERDGPLFDKIALCITMTWICINMATYRGRYRPRVIVAFKVCYPLFIFLLLMAALGRL
ncbi:MAG: hypothetical protein IKP86_08395 [Anaerolineaceae bacterium]|nr:hypothetical protein [Anaerolineaceae bacterium]